MPESVWDYPRPPRVEPTPLALRVEFAGIVLAETTSAYRVLETSHPPVYYIPPADVAIEHVVPSAGRQTLCEWKGGATYWDASVGDRVVRRAAWSYRQPVPAFEVVKDHLAFYPGLVECFVDDERVLGSTFAGLRRLSERLRSASERVGPELSMGMTNDLGIAIREGSTMIRIGTALFGERDRT